LPFPGKFSSMIVMKRNPFPGSTMLQALGIILILEGFPGLALADIFRWEDKSGVIHFTDNPDNIPMEYRGSRKTILKTPAESGKPSLSTVGTSGDEPSPAKPQPQTPEPSSPTPAPPAQRVPEEDLSAMAAQLRAKIAAKEQFIARIDQKRSRLPNPLANRFVSPEDLELYKKYTEELPQDREALREIESASP